MRPVIEKFVPIHKDDVPALTVIQMFDDPCPRDARDLAPRNDVNVIQQYLLASGSKIG
jgi:hypothetical protein